MLLRSSNINRLSNMLHHSSNINRLSNMLHHSSNMSSSTQRRSSNFNRSSNMLHQPGSRLGNNPEPSGDRLDNLRPQLLCHLRCPRNPSMRPLRLHRKAQPYDRGSIRLINSK
jgi:hypothetical protein